MQPYTPHGDSNMFYLNHKGEMLPMQPYTPHGDSNSFLLRIFLDFYEMQPYTPHGDSNTDGSMYYGEWMMQPYTPHGDSNITWNEALTASQRCNLIPLTGTVTML